MLATWDTTKDVLINHKIIASWDTPPKASSEINADSAPEEIHEFSQWLSRALVAEPKTRGLTIGIDWAWSSVFWGNRKAGLKLTYFMGNLAALLTYSGNPAIYVEPNHVREVFNLPPKAPKEQVWKVSPTMSATDPDERDALILSYIIAKSLKQEIRF